jgi:hypothetical protein
MAVIIWQLTVVGSIVVAFFVFGQKPARYLCYFWSFWTLFMLVFPPLIAIQLLSTWGTYAVCNNMTNKTNKIHELEKVTSNYSTVTQKNIKRALKESNYSVILGDEHRDELYEAINSSREYIVILSGWISSTVISYDLIDLMRDKIKEKVHFYIGYGWEDSFGQHSTSNNTMKAINRLVDLKLDYPEFLVLCKYCPASSKNSFSDN